MSIICNTLHQSRYYLTSEPTLPFKNTYLSRQATIWGSLYFSVNSSALERSQLALLTTNKIPRQHSVGDSLPAIMHLSQALRKVDLHHLCHHHRTLRMVGIHQLCHHYPHDRTLHYRHREMPPPTTSFKVIRVIPNLGSPQNKVISETASHS